MQTGGEPCPRCGMKSDHWAHNGQGYQAVDQTYCCQGCAEKTGCTCVQAMSGVSGK